MQNIRSLPLIHVLCCTRFWSVSSEFSVWTANDSPAISLYGRDDSVHYDQIHKEKVPCTWGWLSTKSRRYSQSVDPLKSEVSSTDFILVPMMLWEYTWSRFILQKYYLDTPKWKGSNISGFSSKPIFSDVLLRF